MGIEEPASGTKVPQRTLVEKLKKLHEHLVRQYLQNSHESASISDIGIEFVAERFDSQWMGRNI
jgi:hypothetical protein